MYILTKNNIVIDSCENGYCYLGNTVICENKGCCFEDATIINIGDQVLPHDIDSVEYKYIQGEFLKVYPSDHYILEVPADGWERDYSQPDSSPAYYNTIESPGISKYDNPIVDVLLSVDRIENLGSINAWNCIDKVSTDTNSITLYTYSKNPPDIGFMIQMKVVR